MRTHYKLDTMPTHYKLDTMPTYYKVDTMPTYYKLDTMPTHYKLDMLSTHYGLCHKPFFSKNIKHFSPHLVMVIEPIQTLTYSAFTSEMIASLICKVFRNLNFVLNFL